MGRNEHKGRYLVYRLGNGNMDRILEETIKAKMYEFNLETFKKDHPRLYLGIKHAMLNYALECLNTIDENPKT